MSLKIMQDAFLWKRFTDESIDNYVGSPNELILDLQEGQVGLRICDGETSGGYVISPEVVPGVMTPTMIGPVNGLVDVDVDLTLISSHFEGYNGDLVPHTHHSSRWQISADENFVDDIEVDTEYLTTAKLNYSLASHGRRLRHNQTYYARVSHKTADGVISSWSNPISFTTRLGVSLTHSHVLQINEGVYDKLSYMMAVSGDGNTLAATGNYIITADVEWDSYVAVFRRSTDGWILQKILTSPDMADDNRYATSGVRLSYDGNTLVVADRGVAGYTGCVYVYVYVNSTWVLQATLEAPDKASNRYFGRAIGLSSSGDLLAVGDIYRNTDATNTAAGAVHIFERLNGVWTHKQIIVANEANTKNDIFGYSVSMSGDGTTLLVCAFNDDEIANNAGAAYIFYRANGQYSQHVKLMATDGLANDNFGFNCVLSGNGKRAVINSRHADTTAVDSGAVYFFEKINSTWIQTNKFPASSVYSKGYGSRAAMSADGRLCVMTGQQDLESAFIPPDVYVYQGGVWSKVYSLPISGLTQVNTLGFSMAMSDDGSVVAIGAGNVSPTLWSDPNATLNGKVYVYE